MAAARVGASREPVEMANAAEKSLDLELHLGVPPCAVTPKSNGAEVVSADLASSADPRRAAENGETKDVEEAADTASDHDEVERPAPVLLRLFSLQPFHVVDGSVSGSADPRNPAGYQEADGDEAAAEPGRKRAKSEPPPTVTDAPAPLLVPPVRALPAATMCSAPRRAQRKTTNLHPLVAHQGEAGATEPTWVRAEPLPRHDLPGDMPLHFVEEKVLQNSDLKSGQTRLLIWSGGSRCLRALLTADELKDCGLNSTRRRTTRPAGQGQDDAKKRENPTKYPGVPVLVHERGADRAASALRLNSFHTTKNAVINGPGYGRFDEGSGFKKGDRIEVWAFRRPHDQHLCFVTGKRDDDRRPAINRQE